mgnify:FL=1
MKINYGRRVHEIVNAALEVVNAADAERKQLDWRLNEGKIAEQDHLKAAAELRQRKAAAVADANLAIEKIRREHEAAVNAWDTLDGSKIDHDDAELLRLCDTMTSEQFQQLCTKHKENSVMLKLLADYADRHADLGLTADRPIDAKTRLTNFNTFCATASRAVKDPNTIAAALFVDGRADAVGVNYSYGADSKS